MARTVVVVDVDVEEEQASRDMQTPSSSRQVVQAGGLAARLEEPAEVGAEEAVRSRTAVPMRTALDLDLGARE